MTIYETDFFICLQKYYITIVNVTSGSFPEFQRRLLRFVEMSFQLWYSIQLHYFHLHKSTKYVFDVTQTKMKNNHIRLISLW